MKITGYVPGGLDPNLPESASTGTVTTGGDLGGTLPAPTVTGLDGHPFTSPGTEVATDLIQFNGSTWDFVTPPAGGLSSVTDGTTTVSPASSMQVPNQSLANGGAGLAIVRWDRLTTIAAAGAAQTLNLSTSDVFDITLTANCTLTFTNPPLTGTDRQWLFIIRQGGSGSYTITWPAAVKWPAANGTPTATPPALFTAVTAINSVVLGTEDGGTTYGANLVGSGSASPLTTKGDLYGHSTVDVAIPVGANGKVLTADSTAAAGVSWQTPAADVDPLIADHVHIDDVLMSGDGSTVAFELPAAPFDAYSVQAFVAGVLTETTQSGALLTTATFGVAPAAGTNNIRFDIVAAVV